MEVGSYEEELIRAQLEQRVSIFACNGFAVIASSHLVVGHIDGVPVETWYNPEQRVSMGKYGVNGQKTDSFLNTKTFLDAWDTLMSSGKIWPFDFVVKVDPDAVFFAQRLRQRVKAHTGQSVYVPNCGKWASGPKLYGSIEVFSIQALHMYERRVKDCKALPWMGWGEDYYMQHCMDIIGVKQASDFQQVGDDRCIAAPCTDRTRVAFHPYKNMDAWFRCFNASNTTMATATRAPITTVTTTTPSVTTTLVTGSSPTLFCWSHMEGQGYEEALIRFQFERRASIFACNGFAVISSTRTVIGYINGAAVETWYNAETPSALGDIGVSGQTTDGYLNTKTFLAAWDTMINSQQVWSYNFMVKVDPDVVFFPDRLRERVRQHVGSSIYVPNCGKGSGDPKLYGAVEVLSMPAFRAYSLRGQECRSLPWDGWGEDYFMQHCMDLLGVQPAPDLELVGDDRCLPAACSDWTRVAYHAFRDVGAWSGCFRTAIGEQ